MTTSASDLQFVESSVTVPHVDTPQSACLFGIARSDITPPVGIYHRMWGAATHERATGIHRPLSATAVTLRPVPSAKCVGDNEQILVALDLCILWHPEMQALLDAVSQQADVPRERLQFVFSHTHAAGLMDRERQHLPGGELIGLYLDRLAQTVSELVRQSRAALQPATIVYGTGHCTLAAHRDFWDAGTKQWVCGFNAEGPADATVLVARATSGSGQLLATFVNYACHPTTLAWKNTLISPDFPGAMRELVERVLPAPCVFLQGASGDLGPREGFVGDVAVADRNGRQLGYASLEALEALPPAGTRFQYDGPVVSGATLGPWSHVPLDAAATAANSAWRMKRFAVDLSYRPGLPTVPQTQADRADWWQREQAAAAAGETIAARDCHAMVERMDRLLTRLIALPPGETYPMQVTLWQVGGGIWLAVESEHYQVLQTQLRKRFPETPIVVMTIANSGRTAYQPEAKVYDTGIYQETIAILAAGCLEKLIDHIAMELHKWGVPGEPLEVPW